MAESICQEVEAVENMGQRAPRPLFHLLRLVDVARALEDPAADSVLELNVAKAQEIGYDGWQELMRECEAKGSVEAVHITKTY